MSIRVRSGTTEDIESLVELLGELFALEADFAPDAQRQRRGLTLMLSAPDERIVRVAEDGDRIVGMVTGQILVSTAEGGLVTLVEDLIVAPPYRGTGVGSRLLADLEGWARPLGSKRLQLLADRDNGPAKAFYEKAGWCLTNLVCLRKTESGVATCPGIHHERSTSCAR